MNANRQKITPAPEFFVIVSHFMIVMIEQLTKQTKQVSGEGAEQIAVI